MDGTLWTHTHGHTYIHSLGPLLTLIPMLSKLDMQHKNYTYTHTELSKSLSGQEVRALWQTRKCFPLQPKSSVSGPPACPPHFACKLFVWCNDEMLPRESKVPVDCFNWLLTSFHSVIHPSSIHSSSLSFLPCTHLSYLCLPFNASWKGGSKESFILKIDQILFVSNFLDYSQISPASPQSSPSCFLLLFHHRLH